MWLSKTREHAGGIWRYAQNRPTKTTVAAICLPWIPLALLITALVSIVTRVPMRLHFPYIGRVGAIACDPNGKIDAAWNWWLPHYWISITMAWGRFTFAAAKAIDLTWDWVVGRGWQALSGWIVYSVFRRCWAMHWQADRNGIPVSASMALQYETASLSAWCTYQRILWSRRSRSSRRLKLDTVVLLAAVLYVLLCPHWLSAMTAYTVPTKPALRDGAKTIDYHALYWCSIVVQDGQRIGMIENACVPSPYAGTPYPEYFDPLSRYLDTYYFNTNDSTINDTMPTDGDRKSNLTVDGRTYSLGAPLLNFTFGGGWGYDNHTYSVADFLRLGVCQPVDYYEWGFSFMLTFTFLVSTVVLGVALYIVWLCTFRASEVADSVFGSLKTAVMVSAAIGESVESDSTRMSNAELERERKRKGIFVPLLDKEEHLLGEEREESKQPSSTVVFHAM